MGRSYIYRRPGRAAYYLSIFVPKLGTSFRESAHTTDERTALERLAEAERNVTLCCYVPPAERKALTARDNMSLHAAVAQYLAKMQVDKGSGAYVSTTAYLLFNFLEFFENVETRGDAFLAAECLPACRLRQAKWKRTPEDDVAALLAVHASDRPARLVTEEMVEAYKVHRLGVDDADETTINNELKALRAFGRWLVRRAGLAVDPFAEVQPIKDDDEPAGRVLQPDEFRGFVTFAGPGLQEWSVVAGLHGLRREEVNHLRPEDVDLDLGVLRLRKHYEQNRLVWRPKFRERASAAA